MIVTVDGPNPDGAIDAPVADLRRSWDIVAFGEPMVEYNQARADRPSGGSMSDGGTAPVLRGFGGDCSNFAIAAARQGARVRMWSALGDDYHGRLLRELWVREGVDDALVSTDARAPTGVYFVHHDANGHHFDFLRKGSAASRIGPDALPHDALGDTRVLHCSGITLAISSSSCDAVLAAAAIARIAGAMVSFDTNLRLRLWGIERARALVDAMLGRCDIALPSMGDMAELWPGITPLDAVRLCFERGAATVALKMGEEGALVARRGDSTWWRVEPLAVQAIDATGAGDAFGGAFVTRLLAGDDAAGAGRYAVACAGLATQGYGAVAPVPRRDAVLAALGRVPAPREIDAAN